MSADELLDIYDDHNILIGTALKSEVHKQGLWHRTVCFLILDTSSNSLIFQERTKSHRHEEEKIPFFVKLNGGHIRSEEPLEEIVRELKEELNIKISYSNLVSLGKIQTSIDISESYKLREFTYYFLVPIDINKVELHFNDNEVAYIISVPIYDGLKLMFNKKKSVKALINDSVKSKEIILTNENFKNFTDNDLYKRIFIAAQRFINKEPLHLIHI